MRENKISINDILRSLKTWETDVVFTASCSYFFSYHIAVSSSAQPRCILLWGLRCIILAVLVKSCGSDCSPLTRKRVQAVKASWVTSHTHPRTCFVLAYFLHFSFAGFGLPVFLCLGSIFLFGARDQMPLPPFLCLFDRASASMVHQANCELKSASSLPRLSVSTGANLQTGNKLGIMVSSCS